MSPHVIWKCSTLAHFCCTVENACVEDLYASAYSFVHGGVMTLESPATKIDSTVPCGRIPHSAYPSSLWHFLMLVVGMQHCSTFFQCHCHVRLNLTSDCRGVFIHENVVQHLQDIVHIIIWHLWLSLHTRLCGFWILPIPREDQAILMLSVSTYGEMTSFWHKLVAMCLISHVCYFMYCCICVMRLYQNLYYYIFLLHDCRIHMSNNKLKK